MTCARVIQDVIDGLPALLTPEAAAEALGVSTRTLRRWETTGYCAGCALQVAGPSIRALRLSAWFERHGTHDA